MLFRIARRYRTKSISKDEQKFVLYLKWGKTGKHRQWAQFDTKEEAINTYKRVAETDRSISEDYRVRMIKQTYLEESVHVPSVKELMDEFPELKGTWKI